ncbi:hypothetical protein APS56_09195 [Pseudalgibacter alginicilyticus]|uniref:Uncharacterized protein n=1 Tax=Pseudalgibacter alginicilyticus TaxID=1736674 RepID=A0A0P0CGH1_9FLAO|nr:hypothetical protein [Pseudalgibacter alginicilyticus]ALJ05287.1 hypothetical protein APS56_09195 [Pseudalgibacter alginicilyticus]
MYRIGSILKNNTSLEGKVLGKALSEKTNYSGSYDEIETASYTILNINFGIIFYNKHGETILKLVIENIMNAHYSTYANWSNLPTKGVIFM